MTSSNDPQPEVAPTKRSRDDMDPIEQVLHDVVERIGAVSEDPDAVLTCNGLVDIIGVQSHAVAILLFALLNLLPGPPGYSIFIGLAIMMFSWLLISSSPMQLRPYIGERRLPLGLLTKSIHAMDKMVGFVAKISSPRWSTFYSPNAIKGLGYFMMLMGALMLFPVPFTNTVPSAGTAIIAVGLLNKDGLAIATGLVVGLVGLAIVILTVWIVLALGFFVGEAIIE
jgi:hypothetical protein